MSHSLVIDEFVRNSESFVGWIEAPPIDKIDEASSALLHMSKLYASALQLMKVDVEKDETEVQERIQSIKNVVGSPDNVTEEKPKITNDLFEELFGEKR